MSNFTPARFVVTANGSKTGGGGNTGKKPWRAQVVMVHQGDEVLKHEFFLRDNDQFLEPGEHRLAPDSVYLTTRVYTDKTGRERTETVLACSNRFVKVPAVAVPPRA